MAFSKGDYWAEVVEADTMEPIGHKILVGIHDEEEKQFSALAETLGVPREKLTLLTRSSRGLGPSERAI